jgi:predicted nucleic acid binding AN1-type Zn finger protein
MCNFINCNLKSMKLIGFCKLCNNSYCSSHRLPESHLCKNLNELKQKAHNNLLINLKKNSLLTKKI